MDDNWHPCCPPASGLVTPVRRRGAGECTGPTAGVLRGPGWLPVGHGWHVPAGTPRTPEQRAYELGARLPDDALLTGWAALRLAGASYFEGLAADRATPRRVPVLMPHDSRLRGRGVLVERTRLPLPKPILRYGIECAPSEIALMHEVRRAGGARHAGVMVDMALASGVVDLERLRAAASMRGRLPPHAAHALRRACAECRSPRESDLLQVWQDVAERDAIMLAHYADLENRALGEPSGRRRP